MSLVAALLLFVGTQVAPAPATPAMRLAELYVPEALVREALRRQVRAMLARNFDGHSEAERLERLYPGTRAAWIDGGLTELDAIYTRELPASRAMIGAAIGRELTPGEADAVAEFLRSDTGQTLLAALFRSIDHSRVPGTGPVSPATARAATDFEKVDAALTPEQWREIHAFWKTPAGRKFYRVKPKLQQLLADENNANNARRFARLEAAANNAVKRHVASQKGAR